MTIGEMLRVLVRTRWFPLYWFGAGAFFSGAAAPFAGFAFSSESLGQLAAAGCGLNSNGVLETTFFEAVAFAEPPAPPVFELSVEPLPGVLFTTTNTLVDDITHFESFIVKLRFVSVEPSATAETLAGVAAGTGIAVLAANVLSWLWGI
jgi:type IV secretion system protein VirB2